MSSSSNLEMVDAIDVVSLAFLITAGGLLATSMIVQQLSTEPTIQPVQTALFWTGTGLSGLGFLSRWLLTRYG